jgi:hypothetical protein
MLPSVIGLPGGCFDLTMPGSLPTPQGWAPYPS